MGYTVNFCLYLKEKKKGKYLLHLLAFLVCPSKADLGPLMRRQLRRRALTTVDEKPKKGVQIENKHYVNVNAAGHVGPWYSTESHI